MIPCPHCGQPTAADLATCEHCGQPLDVRPIPPPRLLSRIQGLIPPEPIISSGRLIETPTATNVQEWQGQIQQALETEPVQEVWSDNAYRRGDNDRTGLPPIAATTAIRHPSRSLTRLIMAGLLILAVLIGQLPFSIRQHPSPRRPAVDMAYTFVEILPRGARVLLSWDYEPTTQGELQLLAAPILQHLTAQHARIASMSLRPLGPAVAAETAAPVYAGLESSSAPTLPPVQLGFIPGDAAALKALSLSPLTAAALPDEDMIAAGGGLDIDPLASLSSFDLIIEFSAEWNASRQWVEQIAVREDVPLIVAASGSIAPLLRPYEQTGQIDALLSGYTDALAYEQILGIDGPATAQRLSQTLAHLFLIAIVFLALIRSLLPHRRS